MFFLNDTVELFVASVLFLYLLAIYIYLAYKLRVDIFTGVFFYFWHTIFALLYVEYVRQNGGDAIQYFSYPDVTSYNFSFGTDGVFWLVGIFKYAYNSFLFVSLIFNFIGGLGLLYFYSAISKITSDNIGFIGKLLILIPVLLPSVSFWSSGIGKDPISFLGIMMILWSFPKNKNLTFAIGVILVAFVRPHIAGLIFTCYGLSLIFSSNLKLSHRALLLSFVGFILIVSIPFVIQYVGLDKSGIGVMEYIDSRAKYNLDGGSSIDLSSLGFFAKIVTYLYRPFPYEASGGAGLLSSLENVFLFLLASYFLFKAVITLDITRFKVLFANEKLFFFLYFIVGVVILSNTTANLGIALRQKWMVLPFFLYIIFQYIFTNKRKGVV